MYMYMLYIMTAHCRSLTKCMYLHALTIICSRFTPIRGYITSAGDERGTTMKPNEAIPATNKAVRPHGDDDDDDDASSQVWQSNNELVSGGATTMLAALALSSHTSGGCGGAGAGQCLT